MGFFGFGRKASIGISSDFDSGNIIVKDSKNPENIRLEIAVDGAANYFQWFNFKVERAAGKPLVMRIMNAGASSYLGGWRDYHAVASYDGEDWFRVDTDYEDGVLTIRHTPARDEIAYAYFAAYPTTRYRGFIDQMKQERALTHAALAETLDGQTIDYFTFGDGPRSFWVIARQHPGESMGSWWMEGFLPALADETNAAARTLASQARLHIIPCMNLDGARRGHLRTNAAGVDLNRAWRNTTPDKSPEVHFVREKMRETGVDFFLDVHGDEEIPNNFIADAKGIPSWNERHERLVERYSAFLLEESRDFQTTDGYPVPPPGKANLDIATNYVAETWNCLSMTLEMPFKDANVNPAPETGWSPQRCRTFAREHLAVMAKIVGDLD